MSSVPTDKAASEIVRYTALSGGYMVATDKTEVLDHSVGAWVRFEDHQACLTELVAGFDRLAGAQNAIVRQITARAETAEAVLSASAEAGEVAGYRGSIPAHAKWCQPGDRQDKQHFIVRFDDPDRGDAVFTDEAEAREFYARATLSWNCWLFGALPAHPQIEGTKP